LAARSRTISAPSADFRSTDPQHLGAQVGQDHAAERRRRQARDLDDLYTCQGTHCLLAGANPVPVNWHGKADEIGYLLSNSGSKAASVHSDFVAAVQQSGTALPLIVVQGTAVLPNGRPEYETWLAGHDPETAAVAPTTGLGMIYTSGTTGKPKGIVRDSVSSDVLMQMVMLTMQRMGIGPGVATIIPAPLYHTTPNTIAVLAMKLGMDITLLARFTPRSSSPQSSATESSRFRWFRRCSPDCCGCRGRYATAMTCPRCARSCTQRRRARRTSNAR
jgi:acyl-CoA synthetase (AMP-forming)/AMP-acid ligase II